MTAVLVLRTPTHLACYDAAFIEARPCWDFQVNASMQTCCETSRSSSNLLLSLSFQVLCSTLLRR